MNLAELSLVDLRSMMFVDGTNFLVELSRALDMPFKAEKPPPNTALVSREVLLTALNQLALTSPVRQFWFASFTGDDAGAFEYRSKLRAAYFTPVIFKKLQGQQEKRVDIALTTELLVNAHLKNFDVAVVVSGDADYLSVVEEAKRYGAHIFGCFFKQNCNSELQIAFDRFYPIEFEAEQSARYVNLLRGEAPL